MRILALRANGLVLPFIHASLVKAFQSLDIEVLDIPVPNSLDDFRSFLKTARKGFQAIFTLDLGADQNFMKNIKELQLSLGIPWIIWFVDDPDGYGFPEVANPVGRFPSVGTGKLSKKIFPGVECPWCIFPWRLTQRSFSLKKLILPASIRGEFLWVPPPIPMKSLIV